LIARVTSSAADVSQFDATLRVVASEIVERPR
jgi:hypothetical protein